MKKKLLAISAVSGILSVALGAFGAHGLKAVLQPEQIAVFETGVRYQFIHTLALFIISFFITQDESVFLKRAAYSFIAGIMLFSFSLYFLSIKSLVSINLNWLGPVTPLGGLFFIIGWMMLLFYALKKTN